MRVGADLTDVDNDNKVCFNETAMEQWYEQMEPHLATEAWTNVATGYQSHLFQVCGQGRWGPVVHSARVKGGGLAHTVPPPPHTHTFWCVVCCRTPVRSWRCGGGGRRTSKARCTCDSGVGWCSSAS